MADREPRPIDLTENVNGTNGPAEGGEVVVVVAEDVTGAELTGANVTDANGGADAVPDTNGSADAGDAGEVVEVNHDDLLGELARAMHAIATTQYERMNAELERRRIGQVEATAARTSSELENLKAASEADISAIDGWAKAEAEKVKQERVRRIEARRAQLTKQLEQRETIKEQEVSAVDAAIDSHRNEIEQFFGRLKAEADPSAIARVASTLPPFPPLSDIAEKARRGAAAEFWNLDEDAGPPPTARDLDSDDSISQSRLMAVIDPDGALRAGDDGAARPWAGAPNAVSVAAGLHMGDENRPRLRAGSTLLRAIPAIRPMMAVRLDPGTELPDAQH